MLSNQEKYTLILLLVKYVESEPLSHRKRDVIHEVIKDLLEQVKHLFASQIFNDDIPF